jgi:hypothetical protein
MIKTLLSNMISLFQTSKSKLTSFLLAQINDIQGDWIGIRIEDFEIFQLNFQLLSQIYPAAKDFAAHDFGRLLGNYDLISLTDQ